MAATTPGKLTLRWQRCRCCAWRSARAAPYAARPRSPPRSPRAGTCGRCCRPSSGAESRRAAGSATDSRCAAGKEWRSSPPACPSCAVARPATPWGSAALAAPTLHPADRSDILPPPADKFGGAPPSTWPFAITVNVLDIGTIVGDELDRHHAIKALTALSRWLILPVNQEADAAFRKQKLLNPRPHPSSPARRDPGGAFLRPVV